MAINCGIIGGVDATCDSLKRVSGTSKRALVFNLSDLRSPIGVDPNGFVSDLEFISYKGLYEFNSAKNSFQGTSTLVVTNGSPSYTHEVLARLYPDSPLDDTNIEDLATAEVGVILKTGNNEWKIYGGQNGLTASADTETTGLNLGEDTANIITLTGSERGLPLRFKRGTDAETLAYLNALVIA